MKTQLFPMSDKWLNAVIDIENQAHSHPWAESIIRKPANKFSHHYVLVKDDNVIGYFFSQCIVGEASLLNIAVSPVHQKKGYGKTLLLAFIDEMKQIKAQEIWLEVRESNQAAIALYNAVGFNEFDRRYNYYPTKNGNEDALVMSYWFDD